MGDAIKATPKKIVICCDGTWQSSVTGKPGLPSNVTRIARTIAKAGKDQDGKVWQQIVFYDAGIGTGAISKVEANVQGATGEGLIMNVLEAYVFIVNNYSPGDKIYCFGFSRGAFTARAVAGMVTDFGVIKPQHMEHFPSLFEGYQKNLDKHTFRKTKEYFEWYAGKVPLVPESKQEETVQMNYYDSGVRTQVGGGVEHEGSRVVELVGVFDTVGSLGLGDTYLRDHASSRRQYEWLNVKWNPYIKHAFHAVALDERRQPFLPTLYYIPRDSEIDEENKALAKDEVDWPELRDHRRTIDQELKDQRQRLEEELAEQGCQHNPDLVQVWFTGVHINVGGGTDDAKSDFEGLANITFAWMIEQCRPYLAFEEFTNDTIADYLQEVAVESARGDQKKHDEPGLIQGGLHAIGEFLHGHHNEKMVRPKSMSMVAPPMIAVAYWAGFRPQDSYSLIFQFISGPVNRAPGASRDMSAETHVLLRDLGTTNEYMHPSVKYRLDTSGKVDDSTYSYKSKALEGLSYTQRDGVYGWFRKDGKVDVWIPEWPIVAALEPEDTAEDSGKHQKNSEMALIDRGMDNQDVRAFLGDHATAWKKANPEVEVVITKELNF